LCWFAVAQHALFAQDPGLQARSTGALVRMHDRAETGVATTGSIIASKTDIANLLNTVHTLLA
jgi:hypothetical protein